MGQSGTRMCRIALLSVPGQPDYLVTMSLKRTRRPSASEEVFDQLARSILEGSWAPGSTLPPEQQIADQCGCSRIVARQAVHRLADLGLVEHRQGGATRVQDPALADSRVALLMAELGIGDWERELDEQSLIGCLGPLLLAHRRASDADRLELARIAAEAPDASLERDFWTALARSTGNRLSLMDLRFWEREAVEPATPEDRAVYAELARLLCTRRDPVPFYTGLLGSLL